MFEKEAEEYRLNLLSELREKIQKGYNCKELVDIEMAYQKGAEFGYNEANEWHYVKDDGTPKVEGHYLVCLRNKDRDIFDCWIYYDKDIGWYSMQIRMKDIYAWKEIVLPELQKDSE